MHGKPVNEKNEPFEPGQLDEAYAIYNIPDTYCLCATQEYDPAEREQYKLHIRKAITQGFHYGKVVAGCRRQHDGCAMFLPLDLLSKVHKLVTAKYPKREVRGPGILKFNPFKASVSPTSRQHTPASIKRQATESPDSPLKYRRMMPSASSSSKGKGKVGPKSSMTSLFGKPTTGSATFLNEDDDDIEEDDARKHIKILSKSLAFSIAVAPFSFASPHARSPPRYSTQPLPNAAFTPSPVASTSTSTSSTSTSSMGRCLTHWQPNQCFFGDVMGLAEPINPSLLPYRNYEISLSPEDQHRYLTKLDQGGGVTHELFMMMFDKCNCDLYFLKDTLHHVHGPSCMDYLYTPPQHKKCPLGMTAMQAITDTINQQPPSPYMLPKPTTISTLAVNPLITPSSVGSSLHTYLVPTAGPSTPTLAGPSRHTYLGPAGPSSTSYSAFVAPPPLTRPMHSIPRETSTPMAATARRASAPPVTNGGALWLGPTPMPAAAPTILDTPIIVTTPPFPVFPGFQLPLLFHHFCL
ncbi:hypothetical protein M422DRAFT_242844 [Sphaerobolus stellatus SS14]|nr:hypothetical protein M422DRAFT_242844 [Sphaerobolus stellatus SS14]